MLRITLATNNENKVREIQNMINACGYNIQLVSLKESGLNIDPEETGLTFMENAYIKAEAAHDMLGGFVLADDSGLCIDYLNGEPGVNSHRWMGDYATEQDRNKGILAALDGVKDEDRTASYSCAMCLILPNGSAVTETGRTAGRIAHEEIGLNGFAYDPIFLPEDYFYKCTMAQLTLDEKNLISHRKRALDKIITYLKTSKYRLLMYYDD
jgi:XTP/dITP diphosphohydrolase